MVGNVLLKRAIPVFFIVLSLLSVTSSFAGEKSSVPVFSTWDMFEVDKLASIWLIKRFVDPNAEIRLFPKGVPITDGTPFDTPEAVFRRYHNISTFEMMRRHYEINTPECIYISKIVHDIEINTWEKKRMPETHAVTRSVADMITRSTGSIHLIETALHYFDDLSLTAPDKILKK